MKETPMDRRWDSEKRRRLSMALWALGFGLAGAVVMAVIEVNSIRRSTSSTAGIGILFIPLTAVPAGLIAALWGLAVRAVGCSVRGNNRMPLALLGLSWGLSVALPAGVAWEVTQGLRWRSAIHEVLGMKGAELEAAFDRSPRNRDRFYLGAIAQNPAASGALLDRIASLPDPDLYERMWSLWDVMGQNGKGLAVMRLVIGNPNVSGSTLEKLASSPHANEYILCDVLANKKTPRKVLERHLNTNNRLMKYGLAYNPNTPVEVLERLARDPDQYTAEAARRTLGR